MTSGAASASDPGPQPINRFPRFYVMVGIPGSGKSTYAKTCLKRALRVSLDDLRLMLTNRAFVARLEPLIVAAGDRLTDVAAGYAATHRMDVVFDATNVTRNRRAPLIERAVHYGLTPMAVYVQVPLSVALIRNNTRPDPVPREVVESFYRRLQPPTMDEGFAQVYVVDAEKPFSPLC